MLNTIISEQLRTVFTAKFQFPGATICQHNYSIHTVLGQVVCT